MININPLYSLTLTNNVALNFKFNTPLFHISSHYMHESLIPNIQGEKQAKEERSGQEWRKTSKSVSVS